MPYWPHLRWPLRVHVRPSSVVTPELESPTNVVVADAVAIAAEPASRDIENIRRVLTAAQRAGRWRAARVSVLPLLIGSAALGAITLNTMSGWSLWRPQNPIQGDCLTATLNIVAYTGLLLSVPPGSAWANAVAAALVCAFFAYFIVFHTNQFLLPMLARLVRAPSCWAATELAIEVPTHFVLATAHVLVSGSMAWALTGRFVRRRADGSRPVSTELLNLTLWRQLGFGYVTLYSAASLYAQLLNASLGHFIEQIYFRASAYDAIWLVEHGAFCAFAFSPSARARVRAWLSSSSADMSAAGGIASLLGGIPPEAAIASGRARLRGVRYDLLSPDDFARSADGTPAAREAVHEHVLNPAASAHAASQPMPFGKIDAFVSHSVRHSGTAPPHHRGTPRHTAAPHRRGTAPPRHSGTPRARGGLRRPSARSRGAPARAPARPRGRSGATPRKTGGPGSRAGGTASTSSTAASPCCGSTPTACSRPRWTSSCCPSSSRAAASC